VSPSDPQPFPFGKQRRAFRAIVSAVVPEAEHLDTQQWAELERTVALGLAHKPANLVVLLRAFLLLVEYAPRLRYGSAFSSLPAPKRNAFCAALEKSRLQVIRKGFWGIRTIALMGYYARPAAAMEIGYRAHTRGWQAYARTDAAGELQPSTHPNEPAFPLHSHTQQGKATSEPLDAQTQARQ